MKVPAVNKKAQRLGKEFWVSFDGGYLDVGLFDQHIACRLLSGLGIYKDTPEMKKFIEMCIISSGYGALRAGKNGMEYYVDKPIRIVNVTEKNWSNSELYQLCMPVSCEESPLQIVEPYMDEYCFYNMEGKSLAFKNRLSYLYDCMETTDMVGKCPEFQKVTAIIAENSYDFKAVDSAGNVIKRFSVHEKPYVRAKQKGWRKIDGPYYVIYVNDVQ